MLTLAAFIVGGSIGFILAALMAAAKDKEEEENICDWLEYKCKINMDFGCGDLCCKFCPAASDCRWNPCQGNPTECGQAIIRIK